MLGAVTQPARDTDTRVFKVGPRTEMAARPHTADHALNHKVTSSLMSTSILNFLNVYLYLYNYLHNSLHLLILNLKIGFVDAWRRERGIILMMLTLSRQETGNTFKLTNYKFQKIV